MLQAFIIVLREGFEAFLIVAITLAYLKKTGRKNLAAAVHVGIFLSILVSLILGFCLYRGANGPMWEGTMALIAAVLVGWLAVHMWQTAPHLKKEMEQHLNEATAQKSTPVAFAGVLIFTTLMISREGMETALLLLQIHEPRIVWGCLLGALAAGAMAVLWVRYSYLINLKLFFQGTAIFLFLFILQILMYAFHEYTEAGIFPNSEALHAATEPYSSDGLYGKWFSLGMVIICAVWLAIAWIQAKLSPKPNAVRPA